MTELLYHVSNLITFMFLTSSVIVAVEVHIYRKGIVRSIFVYSLIALFIISAINSVFDMRMDEFSCNKLADKHFREISQ